jgi:large subunit ribosomal protein L25
MATAQLIKSFPKDIPPRLLRFFKKYPPSVHSSLVLGSAIPANRHAPKDTLRPSRAPPQPPSEPNGTAIPPGSPSASAVPSTSPPAADTASPPTPAAVAKPKAVSRAKRKQPFNPFLPFKNHTTGKWHGALIGLRKQADLVKLAVTYGVEPLLPPTVKSTEYKKVVVEERGNRVKGTGVGEKVKGHKWERTLKARLETRRQAMVKMPLLIREWKEVSTLLDFVARSMLWSDRWLTGIYRGVMGEDGRSIRSNAADLERIVLSWICRHYEQEQKALWDCKILHVSRGYNRAVTSIALTWSFFQCAVDSIRSTPEDI